MYNNLRRYLAASNNSKTKPNLFMYEYLNTNQELFTQLIG